MGKIILGGLLGFGLAYSFLVYPAQSWGAVHTAKDTVVSYGSAALAYADKVSSEHQSKVNGTASGKSGYQARHNSGN